MIGVVVGALAAGVVEAAVEGMEEVEEPEVEMVETYILFVMMTVI